MRTPARAPDLAVQMGLIGIAGPCGDRAGAQAGAEQPDRAAEPEDAAQRRRPVSVDRRALPLHGPVRPADMARCRGDGVAGRPAGA